MSIVTLVSGGLDSTLMSFLAWEDGIEQHPIYINYGQINYEREFSSCIATFKKYNLPEPKVMQIREFGNTFSSGLTDPNKRIVEDAFLPCRNLLFLTIGAAYAFQCGAKAVSIGLLNEIHSIFPDQTKEFVQRAESMLTFSLGRKISIIAPLMSFTKADIVQFAKEKNITGTYSCHAGTEIPCGKCIACREYIGLEV